MWRNRSCVNALLDVIRCQDVFLLVHIKHPRLPPCSFYACGHCVAPIACTPRVAVHAACALLVNTALQQPCLAQLSSDPLPSPHTAAQMPFAACPRGMLLTPGSTDRRQREELALIIKEAPHHASKPSTPIEDMFHQHPAPPHSSPCS